MCVIQSIIVHVKCTKIWRKKALMIILKHLKMPTCRQTICHMFIGVHLWYHHDLYPFCSEYTAFSRDFFYFHTFFTYWFVVILIDLCMKKFPIKVHPFGWFHAWNQTDWKEKPKFSICWKIHYRERGNRVESWYKNPQLFPLFMWPSI